MLVDEPHERGDGRSSSAAKKAEAVFKIAFARRSSRFSRSRSTRRRRSSGKTGLGPGIDLGLLDPAPQRVTVDAQLITDPAVRTGHRSCRSGSTSRSSTRRIALSRSSSGYFRGAGLTPPFRGINASTRPGAVHDGFLRHRTTYDEATAWAHREPAVA